ncbi:23S rRNA pseudouridine(2605) synthase RluB [Microbacteriaceae bacterium 4G12]
MERLQKVIAQAGIASRRKAEELIQQGKVKVNGKVVTELGTKVGKNDKIEVDNVPIQKEEPVYFLLYKPTGVISTVSDDKGRKVVTDFFPLIRQRIFPVGRLDYDTSGLLLMTNDGDFANVLMHPKHEIEKVYVAKIKGQLNNEKIRMLEKGVMLEDGKTAPAQLKILSSDRRKETGVVQITIHEGRNRQVRRMFAAVGCEVVKLKRERYAFLDLAGLRPGDARALSPHEIKQLRTLATKIK